MPVGRVRLSLPAGFAFGATTSAYPVEGASAADGRTPSIWDVFAGLPGRITDGTDGRVADDHYHRWAEDLDLLDELGVQAYRLSLSWSRLQPGGAGRANPAGISFYDRIIDRLLSAGIEPFVGLHHWDMPLEVMERGGWLSRQTTDAFADFTELAGAAFGDRVAAWTTVDEPLPHMAYGYAVGIDAPGLTLLGGAFSATHHQLLAHGRAVQVLRSLVNGSVGIVNHHTPVLPAGPTAADRSAARFYDSFHNRQFADPVLLGRYPEAVLSMPGAATDVIADGDLALIAAPLDFYGITYARPTRVAAAPSNASIPFTLEVPAGARLSAAGWPIDPEALLALLTSFVARYPSLPPIWVTGAGAAFDDSDEDVDADADRIAYLNGHLEAIGTAIARGCAIRGYFHHSLLDSWEWAEGFTRKLGLVRVGADLERVPRASFAHYRDLISEVPR